MKRFLPRLTYANVVSTLCLFLVLGGGAAIAAGSLRKNSVGTAQLKANAVTGAKVKNGTLKANDLAAGTIPSIPAIPDAFNKAESNARYLRGTVTVVAEIPTVAANSFQVGVANCPNGFQAIGGGVDSNNIFAGKVSESAPVFGTERTLTQSLGQHGPATGWGGAISTEGAAAGTGGPSRVVAICAPIG